MFTNDTDITSVTIPNTVTSIGDYAFWGCTSLESVAFGNSLSSIGARTFADCTSLVNIAIPEGVTSIGASAFDNCYALLNVSLPTTVTFIDKYAFTDYFGLVLRLNKNHTYAIEYAQTENIPYVLGKYTVTFQNYDGSVIASGEYYIGDYVSMPQVSPTRPADQSCSYSFDGWDSPVVACDGDKVYTAQYSKNYIQYTVIFKNHDGSILQSNSYRYGDPVYFLGDIPTKPADETYIYSFAGWDNDVVACDGNKEYIAVFASRYIVYTVTFKNYDGTVLQTDSYRFGQTVTPPTQTPEKPAEGLYVYHFIGWDSEVVPCNGDKIYTAVFGTGDAVFTIIFQDYNGKELQSGVYHYGDTVTAPSITLTRPTDKTASYTFIGWDSEIVPCNGNKTYTAVYRIDYIEYTVSFKNYDGSILQTNTYHYGDTVTPPATPVRADDNTYTYTFTGWNTKVLSTCNGNKTYTAQYSKSYIQYTVIFKNYDGSILQSNTYRYGDTVTPPAALPVKPADDIYTYVFVGWDSEISPCDGNKIYTALFEQKNDYISFGSAALHGNAEIKVGDTFVLTLKVKDCDPVNRVDVLLTFGENIMVVDAKWFFPGKTNEPYNAATKQGTLIYTEPTDINGALYEITLKALGSSEALQYFGLEVTAKMGDKIVLNTVVGKDVVIVCDSHKYGAWDYADEQSHKHSCTVCGLSQTAPHNYKKYVYNNDATCTEDGTETAKCADCGASNTQPVYGSALGHIGGSATCDTPAVCTRCNETYGDKDATKHGSTTLKNDKKANCTEEGYTGDLCCDICGTVTAKGSVLPKSHPYQTNVIPATYTKKGYTEHICPLCNDTYQDAFTKAIGLPKLNLQATTDTVSGQNTLYWTAIDEADGYEIYYATSEKGKYSLYTKTTDASVAISVTIDKTYYFKVRAVCAADSSLHGGLSDSLKLAGKCGQVTAQIGNTADGYPLIKWNKVSGAKNYEIWYATSENGSYKKLASTTSNSYTYKKAAMDTYYYFKVRAYGKSTTSAGNFSETKIGWRKLSKPAITATVNQSGKKITVQWKKISGAYGYEVQVSINGNEYTTLEIVSAISFVHENLTPGNTYTYRVRALNTIDKASGDYGAEKSAVLKVDKPTVTITLSENGKPQLHWEKVEGATSFKIYYATSKSGKYTLLTTTEATDFVYEAAKTGKTAYFKVCAVDANGVAGANSSVVSIKSK